MQGFFNRILIVDLTARAFHHEPVPDEVYKKFLGGKGLATWLLLREDPVGVDPLSPDNRLIFAVGPTTDQKVHGSARYGVFTKSPLTGLFCESYSGMKPADRISRTGHDAIVIRGAADTLVLLEISDQGVVFHDARDLAGLDSYATQDAALARVAARDASALTIGVAGENLVRFATINNDYWRCAGRTGPGAVMGSKNVKAIVFHGSQKRSAADPALLAEHYQRMMERSRTDQGVKSYKKYGTTAMVSVSNTFGVFPTKYWTAGTRENWEKITGDALYQKCDVQPHACPRCFMACGKMSTVREGPRAGIKIEGPEFETIYAFGGLCLVEEIEDIIYLNDLCDRLGIDTITSGNLAAFTMYAHERGAIDYSIEWGDVAAIARLLELIARREGIGQVLAEGIVPTARAWGLEDHAIHVKGLEPAGYDPRVLKGMGLAYATSDRGACHLRCTFYKPEIAGMIDPDATLGKAEMFIDFEDRATLFDAMIQCRFFRDLLPWDDIATLIKGATGMDLDQKALSRLAANITDQVRRFNLREGMTPDHERLPRRFFTEPVPPKGKIISPEQMQRLLADYYRLRGWDRDGRPPLE